MDPLFSARNPRRRRNSLLSRAVARPWLVAVGLAVLLVAGTFALKEVVVPAAFGPSPPADKTASSRNPGAQADSAESALARLASDSGETDSRLPGSRTAGDPATPGGAEPAPAGDPDEERGEDEQERKEEDEQERKKDEPPALSISGSVLDDRGRLLPGITVTAQPAAIRGEPAAAGAGGGAMSRVSDQNGMFTFEPLEEGEYDLTAVGGEQYQPAKQRVRAGVASAELRLQRLRSVRVHGVVSDTHGAPLDEVRVRALGDRVPVLTDTSGAYEITVDLVKAGEPPVLAFDRDQYRELRRRIESVLHSDADSVRLDVQLEPSELNVALTGRILGPDHEPVPGAKVWLSSPDPRDYQHTVSGAGGEYQFAEVEIGDAYRAGVEHGPDYEPYVSDPFPVGPADTVHDMQLKKAGDGWLTGQVVNPEGAPLEGFTLWLNHASGGGGAPLSFQTGAGGRFTVEEVTSGSLKIETRSQPHLQAGGITLLPGETKHVVVPLDWGSHWLFGQVVDQEGTPVAQARVVLQWNQRYPDVYSVSRREVSTDRLGYFSFSNLGAGDHVLTVMAPGFETARTVKDPRFTGDDMRIALQRQGSAGMGSGGHD